jgi:NADPH2:quinone reductase
MRAVVGQALGAPENYAIQSLPDVLPGPGEAVVAIRAAGVSFVDVLIASGRYQVRPETPFIPGTEFAGMVSVVGDGVTDLAPGDPVCGSWIGGAFAEQIALPVARLKRLPDGIPFDQAAVCFVSAMTAYQALVRKAAVKAGETVLVLGAAGAVGTAAVQLARHLGARVIASASSDAKRAFAIDAGAEASVASGAADWRAAVKAVAPQGLDVVIDPVGGGLTEAAFRSLNWGGRHVIVGFASGDIPALPVNLPLLKGAALHGVDVRQFGMHEPEASAADTANVLGLLGQGVMRPVIAGRFAFARFADAMHRVSTGESAGRVVIDIGA